MKKETDAPAKVYDPSEEIQKKISETYDDIDMMFEVVQSSYPEFGQNGEGKDRTLRQFIDDCQKRANSYVPSREAQGKESWQANVFTPTTRNKIKALLAGAVKSPPDISITAKNKTNKASVARAEIVKILVSSSFVEGDKNPEIDMFFSGWDSAIQGTVIELDDYIRIKNKVKVITDYDPATGEVSFEEKEEYVQDEAVAFRIPLTNFLVWNAYIRDIQKQPKIAWVDYIDECEAEYQFGDFKNWEYVKAGSHKFNEEDTKTFFLKQWQNRVKGSEKKYEVVRYYDKHKDCYRIIVNGVLLLDAPMLWGKTKKRYPFPKSIYEPFANSEFFWGNSLVNILMAEQDVENALINSLTDKTYRSLNKPMLIGRVNRDNFDLEDEWVDGDTKIYVDDVSQVTPMPIEGATNAEITMLKIIQGGLQNDSSDNIQQGATGSGSTAREVVIANERADELKGLFYTFLKDLWLQKYRIRTVNVLMNYGQAKTRNVVDEEGGDLVEEYYKSFTLPSAQLSNGGMGQMEIQVVGDQSQLKRPYELDVEEEKYRQSGQPTEIMQMTSTFLDDYDYDLQIMTESLYQKSKALKMAEGSDKIMGAAKMFPQIFQANNRKFFESFMELYGDNADKYQEEEQPQVPPELAAMMGGGQQSGQPGTQPTPAMGALPTI